jgi:hypothetical protein
MTIIKNHFEVFILTSKKQGNGIIESKVGLFNKGQFTHICQLNVSCGQDSVSGIVITYDYYLMNAIKTIYNL